MMAAKIVLIEAMLLESWRLPDDRIYCIFFSFDLVLFVLSRLFASIPASRVPFAHIWRSSKAALPTLRTLSYLLTYDRVRRAGNKAWTYVSGIGCV